MYNLDFILVQKILIILFLFCETSLAYNQVYILTSNIFDNINTPKDASSIKLYLIILSSVGIIIFIVAIICCLLMVSTNIDKNFDINENNEILYNAVYHDTGVQCDTYYSNNTKLLVCNKLLNNDIEEQANRNDVDNRKKISLRIKTSSRKLHHKQ